MVWLFLPGSLCLDEQYLTVDVASTVLELFKEHRHKVHSVSTQFDGVLQQKSQCFTNPAAIVNIANAAVFIVFAEAIKKAQNEISDEEFLGAVGLELLVVNRSFGVGNRKLFPVSRFGTMKNIWVRELMASSRSDGD